MAAATAIGLLLAELKTLPGHKDAIFYCVIRGESRQLLVGFNGAEYVSLTIKGEQGHSHFDAADRRPQDTLTEMLKPALKANGRLYTVAKLYPGPPPAPPSTGPRVQPPCVIRGYWLTTKDGLSRASADEVNRIRNFDARTGRMLPPEPGVSFE